MGRIRFSIRSLPSFVMNEHGSLDYFVRDNRYGKSSDYNPAWDKVNQNGIAAMWAYEDRQPIELEIYYEDVTKPLQKKFLQNSRASVSLRTKLYQIKNSGGSDKITLVSRFTYTMIDSNATSLYSGFR